MYKKILLPIDGSEIAKKAAKEALFVADSMGAEIIVMTTVETNPFIEASVGEAISEIEDLMKKEADRIIDEIYAMDTGNVKMTPKIAKGNPAQEILDTSDKGEIDLIVIGSTGKSSFDKLILGSVADNVTTKAKCSVLVVH
ncbi:universal stress protein [Methanobrevibacter sp. DSM 116169]|uniref:universal stress protein n=1 Tax=Methanobrevibacter sp. DSM 116169 TaxID=3242727 RepID=UPI0038FC5615